MFNPGQRWVNLNAVNPWNGNDCHHVLSSDSGGLCCWVSELINWIMQGYLLLKQCLDTSCCQYQINVSLNSHLTYWPKKRKLISRQLIISSIDAPVEMKKIALKLASAVDSCCAVSTFQGKLHFVWFVLEKKVLF